MILRRLFVIGMHGGRVLVRGAAPLPNLRRLTDDDQARVERG